MKLNRMILVAALGLLSTAAYAQTGRATGTPFGSGEDSIRCRQSISLLTSFGRTGNYADAYEPWQRAYNDCPASSKNIYIIGAKILHWKHAQAKTPADKKKILDRLMKLYDDRITYFGDDAKVGAAQIIANKIEDYKTLGGADADFTQVYKWAKPVVERYKEQTPIQVLYYYAFSSRLIASKDESKIDQYINEYTQAAEYADAVPAAAETDEAKKVIEVYKNQMDGEFAQSGLASCDKLEKTYTVDKIDTRLIRTTCRRCLHSSSVQDALALPLRAPVATSSIWSPRSPLLWVSLVKLSVRSAIRRLRSSSTRPLILLRIPPTVSSATKRSSRSHRSSATAVQPSLMVTRS